MLPALTLFCTLTLGGSPHVESICVQAVPANQLWARSPNRTQAVVLIHGFHFQVRSASVPKAEFRPWQKNDSPLVKELGKFADVFTFAYGQNVPLDTVVANSKLSESVARLRRLGYTDVVLVGHSAGGLIARHFVEDNPRAGVTKVIQVCAPNGGSPLAKLTAHKSQKPFMNCLTIENRKICLDQRAQKRIPDQVQFVCVVARSSKTASTDGVVPCALQWTADLQKQGIPVIGVLSNHRDVVRDGKYAAALATLVRENQPRWPLERIEKAKREIVGKSGKGQKD